MHDGAPKNHGYSVKPPKADNLFKTDEIMPIRAVRYSDSHSRNMTLQFRGSNGEWRFIPEVTIDRQTGKEI